MDKQTIEMLNQYRSQIGGKFDKYNIGPFQSIMGPAVQTFLATYNGDFEFLLEMKAKPTLYPGQVAGILNCMFAAAKQAADIPETMNLSGVGTISTEARRTPKGFYIVYDDEDRTTLLLRDNNFPDAKPDTQIASYKTKDEEGKTIWRRFSFVDGTKFRVWQRIRDEQPEKDVIRIDKALQVLLNGNYVDFGMAYAMESQLCFKCGRPLEDENSNKLGVGPICLRRVDINMFPPRLQMIAKRVLGSKYKEQA